MLCKLGVDISRLERQIRSRLTIIDYVFFNHGGSEAVVISTYEGDHDAKSLHYANKAIDLRLPGNSPKVIDILKSSLGVGYDVVLEKDHVHVEFDPK